MNWRLGSKGNAFTPFLPLGGVTPLQPSALESAAAYLKTMLMQVARVRLLQRSSNILLIPGTWSVAHLRENVEAIELRISADTLSRLDC